MTSRRFARLACLAAHFDGVAVAWGLPLAPGNMVKVFERRF